MTRLCLIGYGKMGKMLESMAPAKDCRVESIIDPAVPQAFHKIDAKSLQDAEVAIDFSHPTAVLKNLESLISHKMNIVVGTTGWNEDFERIKSLAENAGIGMVYGANFSLGLNLFSRILSNAVQIIDRFDDYDILGWEQHHAGKADSPSGTAIELARLVLEHSSQKDSVVWDRLQRPPQKNELHFASMRGGYIPGTHVLCFDSEADSIELVHRVRNRNTFAAGALAAAKWIKGKSGVYSFGEVIGELLC